MSQKTEIAENTVVAMHYTLKDDQGQVIDSSEGQDPLTYLQGAGNIIPGLEAALVGKGEGEALDVRIDPKDGYGDKVEELVQTVNRSVFEGVESVEPGMVFQAESPDGNAQRIHVVAVDGDEVTIDANHPLAGVALNFSVNVEKVREATPEELEHGQVQ